MQVCLVVICDYKSQSNYLKNKVTPLNQLFYLEINKKISTKTKYMRQKKLQSDNIWKLDKILFRKYTV